MAHFRHAVCLFAGIVVCIGLSPDIVSAGDTPTVEARRILKDLENARTNFKPFRLKGTATRFHGKSTQEFQVESEGANYRITELSRRGHVSVHDGEVLLTYDGADGATISRPDERTTLSLTFDPKALGISSGLYSDLSLKESIAYQFATNIVVAEIPAGRRQPDLVGVELTDRFGQRIRFEIEKISPYRVRYYSKTTPRQDGGGVFSTYVNESEYWPDRSTGWIPKKLTMYTLDEGREDKHIDEIIVELERPAFVSAIDPGTWSLSGLSLPFGQPVVDLRIHKRIGYWNGKELVKDLPSLKTDER